jgi:hypothetical protein
MCTCYAKLVCVAELALAYAIICHSWVLLFGTHRIASWTWTCSVCSGEKMVRMAYLGVIASHTVNGVAAIHSSIIRDDLFKDFAEVWPNKFTNVTNGVTQRRWLAFCNEPLSCLITQRLGTDAWIKCASYKFFHTVLVLPFVQQVVWMVRIKSIRRAQVAPQSLATFCGSAQSHHVPQGSVMHVIQCSPFCWHGHCSTLCLCSEKMANLWVWRCCVVIAFRLQRLG